MDTAGKLVGIIVFLIGVVLLGLVFKYTVDTVGNAEAAVRRGDLRMPPLFGRAEERESLAPAAAPAENPGSPSASAESATAPAEPLSPMVRFGIIVGARILGLLALGFIAGLIATQGARMCFALRAYPGKELVP